MLYSLHSPDRAGKKGSNKMNRFEKELMLWKTKKAAQSNAQKLTSEFQQVGTPTDWVVVQKSNGWWTVERKVA